MPLAAALSAAMLAGCSGNPPPSTDISDPNYVQGVTDSEILIANSAATSGTYAPVGGPFIAGLQGYLNMVNAQGGIAGRKITLLHTDDEFDPAKGSAALTKFVEDDKVFAIVGDFGAPVVAANVGQLKDYGIPAVHFVTGIGQLYAANAKTNADGYNLFPVQPIYLSEGGIMVAYATGKFQAKKLGIIYTNDDAGMDFEKGAVAQIKSMQGIDYVEQQVPAGAADVSAAVTAIKQANVDFVIVGSIQGTMPTIVKELAAQSVNKDCITSYVNESFALSQAVVNDIQGKFDVYGLGWVDFTSPDAQAALAQYQANVDPQYATNLYGQTGWVAAYFFCEGLRRVENGQLTWASFMKAMEQAPINNPFGGAIDYSNGQRLGSQVMNLSKVVPESVDYPAGWQQVEPLQTMSTLLGQ